MITKEEKDKVRKLADMARKQPYYDIMTVVHGYGLQMRYNPNYKYAKYGATIFFNPDWGHTNYVSGNTPNEIADAFEEWEKDSASLWPEGAEFPADYWGDDDAFVRAAKQSELQEA